MIEVPGARRGRPAARSWPSFSIAMYSWVPANELESATGRRGCRGSAAALSGVGLGAHDLVEGALHVEHHRVERPAGVDADGPHGPRGVVELARSPMDWASRRAGSMVSTTTRAARARPRAAPARRPSSSCPTPPDPQHTMMPVRGVVEQPRRRRSEPGRPASSADPLLDERVGEHGDSAVLDAAGERGQLAGAGAPSASTSVRQLTSSRARRCGVRAPLGEEAAHGAGARPDPDRREVGADLLLDLVGVEVGAEHRGWHGVAHLVDDEGADPEALRGAAARRRRPSPAPASPRAG